MFNFVAMNWRGRPLTSYRTLVELAAATTTRSGLKIRAEWDDAVYQTGTKVTDAQLKALPIRPDYWLFRFQWGRDEVIRGARIGLGHVTPPA